MKWLALVLAVCPTIAFAQSAVPQATTPAPAPAAAEIPRYDFYAGYSYLNIDTNGLTSRQSANGWSTAFTANFSRWLAAEFDGAGYYKTYDILGIKANVSDYSYVAGPRINFRPVFVHALLGGDHLSGHALGESASQDGLAGAFGGGVEHRISGPWGVRVSADYVFSRHNIFGGSSFTQNNYRISGGIVYSFGGSISGNRVATTQPAPPPTREPGEQTTFHIYNKTEKQ